MGNAGDPGRVGRLPAPRSKELAGRDGVVSPDLIGGSVGPAGATLPTGPTPDASARPPLVFVRAGQVPYELAWSEQRRRHAARLAGEVPDAVLLLEHPSVY